MATKPRINYKLLDELSSGWGERFRKGLTAKDYKKLSTEPGCCIVGCFYGYTENYYRSASDTDADYDEESGKHMRDPSQDEGEGCSYCANFADDVTHIMNSNIDRQGMNVDLVLHSAKFSPTLRRLDAQGVIELNEMLEKFHEHVLEAHPHILKAKVKAK